MSTPAERISASELIEGEVYLSVNFVDEQMLIPVVEPVVFVGRNLEPEDVDQVYFQDIDSFRSGVRYGSDDAAEEATFYSGSESEVSHIFEYDQALDALMACAHRRRESANGS